MNRETTAPFSDLLTEAITKPGIISAAYGLFHNFSVGNMLLAAMQLAARGLPSAPIASFNRWKELGRQVKKGEKAISLFMPITVKKKEVNAEIGEKEVTGTTFTAFAMKPRWFSLDQTDGEPYAPEIKTPAWDSDLAMAALNVTEIPFEDLRGNVMGYATGRNIAISPLAVLKHKTRFHEIAHVVLGHTAEGDIDGHETTPRDIREVEAEGTAYILCSILDLPGQDECRGYIQAWLGGQKLPEKTARRIFTTADKILKAGQPAKKDPQPANE